MPSIQRGRFGSSREDRGRTCFRDERGTRKQVGGFKTKGEASQALASALDFARLGALGVPRDVTVSELVDRYLAQHDVDPVTITTLQSRLRQAEATFGDRRIVTLQPDGFAAWRKTLSPGARHGVFWALKQVLEQAHRWKWIDENPARHVKNSKPKAPEIEPFTSWDEIDAIAAGIDPRFAPIVVFAVGTGLRPEEWIALERRDLDREAGVVSVEHVFTQGRLKPCAKTSRQRRRVPLRQRVLDALDRLPPRLDSPLLFPAARRPHRARKVAARPLGACAPGRGDRAPAHLRHEAHLRDLVARRGRLALRPLATDGHERRDDRRDLRPLGAGRRGGGARAPRRFRLELRPRLCVLGRAELR